MAILAFLHVAPTELASQIKQVFQKTPGVVDVDWYVEDPQTEYDLKVDLDKASLHGISAGDVTRTLQVGLSGGDAGLLHDPASREDIPIRVRLSHADRLVTAFVGLNLFQSGLTNWCPAMLILKKLGLRSA